MSDDDLSRYVLKLAQEIHRHGWDKPPFLAAIHRRSDGAYRMGPPFSMPWDKAPPGEVMELFADIFEDEGDPIGQMLPLAVSRLPDLHGLIMSCEAWANSDPNTPPGPRRKQALADLPGTVEVRMVYVMTIDGDIWMVYRRRGEKPAVHRQPEASMRIPISILRMLKAVCRHMPDAEERLAKLDAVKVRTEDDLAREWDARQEGATP